MAELPKLSERTSRLHVLRWDDHIKRHGFNGDHLKWHESGDRRRRAARPAFSLAPPPPPILHAGSSSGRVTFCGSQGEPLTYEEWHRREMAAWAARENDPAIIDSIGIEETIMLAKARFVGIVRDYLAVWADTNGDSDEFTRWLEGIGVLVGCEVGDIWRKTEWHSAWFERACRMKVDEALRPLMEEWKSRACRVELLHLENPHLSLRSLVAAGGDINLAVKFEPGAPIDTGRRVRDSQRLTDSATSSGDGPVEPAEHATVSNADGGQLSTAADRSGGSQAAGRPESTATGGAAQPASVNESTSGFAKTTNTVATSGGPSFQTPDEEKPQREVTAAVPPVHLPPAAVDESASASAAAPPTDVSRSSPARKREKPTGRYSAIDKMLTNISDAKPKNHDQVFRLLEERRVRIPHAEPFESCGGWRAGFRSDPQAARAWLSKRWSLLKLPGFPRGPKQ